MEKQHRKTIWLFIAYIIVMIFQYVAMFYNHDIIDINPITAYVRNEGRSYLYIYSIFDHLIIYITILVAIMLLYTVVKKECIKVMGFCSKIISFFMVVSVILGILFISDFGIRGLAGGAMLFCLSSIKHHMRDNYPEVGLIDILKKYNFYKVFSGLSIIIIINIIYILFPKTTLYVFEHIGQYNHLQYEVEDDFIESVSDIKIEDDMLLGIDGYEGWVFKANSKGNKTLSLFIMEIDELEECIEITISVDANLRFHNVLNWDYIRRIYPLNLFIIICSLLCILPLLANRIKETYCEKEIDETVLRYKSTIYYFMAYLLLLMIHLLFINNIVDLNPITKVNYDNSLWICTTIHHFFVYMSILFGISVAYTIKAKECIKELYISCFFVKIMFLYNLILSFYTFQAYALSGICSGLMLILLQVMKKHFKDNYNTICFEDRFTKYSTFKTVGIFFIIIAINIIYICIPKGKLYVIEGDESCNYEIAAGEECVSEIEEICLPLTNNKLRTRYYDGWIFKAENEGTIHIYGTDKSDVLKKVVDEKTITVGSDLKFHNVLNWNYIRKFYPLNVYIIAYCSICIILIGIRKKIM